jgi:hypothetical protein
MDMGKQKDAETLEWERRCKEQGAAFPNAGCSGTIVETFHLCCVEHDIAYRTGLDLWGNPTTRKDADLRFKRCMQTRSVFGVFSGMAFARWLIVRLFSSRAWKT